MRKRLIIFTAALTMLCAPGWAQKKKGNVLDIKESITDNSIIYPESFETDTQALLEGWYMKNYTATDDRYRTSPDAAVTDEVLIERLKNIPSVIEMPYNQIVKKYIERYTKNGRSLVTVCLGLGNYYLPIIEQALEAEGLPNELKYLPMIESAFNPNAVSRAGATGLWQFMLAAAKGYDMEVSSLVDERRDPYESSKKGAKLLKDLYNTYGKWDLAIAAYNCGPGNVNKAIRRAGGDPKQHDFWSIYNYLPSETRGYFPMFVAANYIMNYYQDHNISPVVPTKPLVTDTVGVASRVNLNQISKVLDIPLDELRLLNPQFRSDVIPGSAKRQYMLILPSRQVAAYIMSEDEIKGYDAQKYARRVVADPGSLPKETDVDIEVAQSFSESDNMVAQQPEAGDIDEDYRMVREASRQREEERKQEKAAATAATAVNTSSASQANRPSSTVNSAGQTVHKVAAGESLQSIAELYRVSPDQLKIWNNLKRNSVRVGQQLVIKGGSAPQQNRAQTASYDADDAPAQAAPAQAAAPAKSRKSSKAQATQASNAKAASSKQAQQNQQAAQTNTKKNSKSKSKYNNAEQQQAAATSKSSRKSKKNNVEQTDRQQTGKRGKKGKNQAAETATNTKTGKKDKSSKKAKRTEPAKPATHDVKKGESLDKIARQHGVSVDDLKKANKNIKGNTIHPGDDLKIPKAGKSSKGAAKDSKATKKSKKGSAKESTKSNSKASSKSTSKKSDSKKKKKK